MQAWDALRATLNPFSIASRPRTVPAGRGAGRRVVFAVDSSDYRQAPFLGSTKKITTPPACADPLFRPHPAPQRRRRALRRRPPRARQRFVLVRVRVPQSPAVPARARRQRQPAQPNLGSAGECRRVGRPGPFPRSVGEARPGIAALKSTIPPVSSTAPNNLNPPLTPTHHSRIPPRTQSERDHQLRVQSERMDRERCVKAVTAHSDDAKIRGVRSVSVDVLPCNPANGVAETIVEYCDMKRADHCSRGQPRRGKPSPFDAVARRSRVGVGAPGEAPDVRGVDDREEAAGGVDDGGGDARERFGDAEAGGGGGEDVLIRVRMDGF